MKNISLASFFKPLGTIFRRFHMTIFIVFLTGCLAYAVIMFTTLLDQSSTDKTYTSPNSVGTIDQVTLNRIKALHTSDEALPASTNPTGRINPFSE